MGGSGSGSWGGKSTIGRTRSYVFSSRLVRQGHRRFGLTFRSDWDEVTVLAQINLDAPSPYVRLSHPARSAPRSEEDYNVLLAQSRPHFGGVRWWFLCPQTGLRVAKLYLPIGGRFFLSREAHGLVHDTRQMCSVHRQSRRISRIAGKLGVSDHDFLEPPEKPPRMRWRTYDRIVESWYEARAAYWKSLA